MQQSMSDSTPLVLCCSYTSISVLYLKVQFCKCAGKEEHKQLDDHLKLLTVWLRRGRLWISVKGQEIIFGGRVLRRFSGGVGCISHTKTHTELRHLKRHSLEIITNHNKPIFHLFVLVLILFYVISTHFLFVKALCYSLNAFAHIALLLK